MIFLPIVERELRGAARRRATYAMRVKIGSGAVLALAVCYFVSLTDASFHFGQVLFWGLSGLCMLYCLAAGRIMTADCLSWEKREGTLGLLFLTDLKGYDVVVGKMAASSFDGFYGMLTVFPILAIPLLAGGLTRGEFWRMLLVLIDAFTFSLAIGLCASAMNRDEARAKGANLALLLWLAAMPPVIGGMLQVSIPGFTASKQLFYTCPVYAFFQCPDLYYRKFPKDFWWCVAINFLLTLLLLLFACRVTPRSWQDKAPGRSSRRKEGRPRRWWRDGSLKLDNAFRKRLLDRNAYLWLAARPSMRAAYVWLFFGVLTGVCAANIPRARIIAPELIAGTLVLFNIALKLWIAAESSRQLATDKKSGAFELLLSTPLTVGEVLRGQEAALRRQFLRPVMLAAIGEAVLSLFLPGRDLSDRCHYLAAILIFVIDAVALGWMGMLAALTAKSHGKATVKTAACILLLPWFIFGGIALGMLLFGFLFVRQYWQPNDWVILGCWFAVGVLVDVFFISRARRQLQTNFRRFAFEPPVPKRRFAWLRDWRTGAPERKALLRARARRVAATIAASLAALAAAVLYDLYGVGSSLPAPVLVSITHSNGPVRVVSLGQGFLFVLPDGTLWSWGREKAIGPPKRTGAGRDWAQVSIGNQTLGLQTNGTLWTWVMDMTGTPKQVGSDRDWAEIRSRGGFSVARKQDGTLWAWGKNNKNQLGNGPGPTRSEPVRIGTNHDWKAIGPVSDNWAIALRDNGTLWTWGEVSWTTNSMWRTTNYPRPIQLCRDSDWVSFQSDNPQYARNQAGELWRLALRTRPGSNVPIASLATMCSNLLSVTFGGFYTTNWELDRYEVRADGTFWVTPWSSGDWPGKADGLTHRFGNRIDWVTVWSGNGTMIGQTSDGTLWTWGVDYGQDSRWVRVFVERIGLIQHQIREILGTANGYGDWITDEYARQTEPRPLMRLIGTNAPRR